MKAYIQQCTSISPQETFDADSFFAGTPKSYATEEVMRAIEPNYKDLIKDANMRRRMSHILKMGVGATLRCISDNNIDQVDGFVTATGMGNLTDTEKFLRLIIGNDEQMLNPTYFILSTGNTFGGQAGLQMHNHGYNVTHVHGGFSFESALIDALMQIDDNDAQTLAVTAADEITDVEFDVMKRMGFWRNGNKMGEGAQSFLLSKEKNNDNNPCILGVRTMKSPLGSNEATDHLKSMLEENGLKPEDIDFMLTGLEYDTQTLESLERLVQDSTDYKQWCGHYQTASSFGTWIGANMLTRQIVPTGNGWEHKKIKYVVIYSEYRMDDYSLILLGL